MPLDPNLFDNAIENAFDHIIITDSDGIIVYANKAVEHTTGYSQQEVIGKTPRLWGGLMEPVFYQEMWRVLKQQAPFVGELKNRRKSGQEYYAEIRVNPVVISPGNLCYYIGIERDITLKKRADEMKSEILSLAAHQLKTPIGQLQAYLDNMITGVVGDYTSTQMEYLKNMREVIGRMVRMTMNILNMSRIERGVIETEMSVFSMSEVIAEVEKDFKESALKKGLEWDVVITDTVDVVGDKAKLTEAVINIVDNAIKYTDHGSISIRCEQRDGFGKIIIADTGKGMTLAALESLFNKQVMHDKASTAKEGNKLGMYIAKTFMTLMKGTIDVASKEGEGTQFTLTLPKEEHH
jgi:PAS domain S-box-containing protein